MENTNASIVIMKTGTQIICDLKEVFDGEGEDKKGVCLLMLHPYELSLISVNGEDDAQDLQVKFSRWCPYSVDYQFKIPYNSVTAIGIPDSGLEQAYRVKIEQVTQLINQNAVIQPEVIADE